MKGIFLSSEEYKGNIEKDLKEINTLDLSGAIAFLLTKSCDDIDQCFDVLKHARKDIITFENVKNGVGK